LKYGLSFVELDKFFISLYNKQIRIGFQINSNPSLFQYVYFNKQYEDTGDQNWSPELKLLETLLKVFNQYIGISVNNLVVHSMNVLQ
jgi:hypothetical protein